MKRFWYVAALASGWSIAGVQAALVWRVDCDGAANDTLTTSNFVGWTVTSASRTQTFASVDGGPVTNDLVASVRSPGGTWTTAQRAMNAGSATNLYRDFVQVTTNLITLALTNLTEGASYGVRLWFYDDDFQPGSVQSYSNMTGGGQVYLGTLTNVASANLAAGNAGLPSSLYDSRYALYSTLTAGVGGRLDLVIASSNTVNAKLNAFEVTHLGGATPVVSYSGTHFAEAAANDGSISNTLTLTLVADSFTGSDGSDFIAAGKAVAGNVPAGLQAVLTRQNATTLAFALTNHAGAHVAADSISNLSLTLQDAAFLGGAAAAVTGASTNGLHVDFNDPPVPVVSYDSTTLEEAAANDGSVTGGLLISLANDTFTGNDNDNFLLAGKASVLNCPAGLQAVLTRQSASSLLFTLSGQATSHAAANTVVNLSLSLLDAAFTSGVASGVTGASRSDIHVTFLDPMMPMSTNETFAYAAGDLHVTSGGLWKLPAGATTNAVATVAAGSLTYPGLKESSGNKVAFAGNGGGDSAVFRLGPLASTIYSNGVLFYSALISVTATNGMVTSSGAGANNYICAFHKAGGDSGTAFTQIKATNGGKTNFNVGVGYSSSVLAPVWDATPLATNTTHLVVVEYEFVPGSTNDVVRLWLNPAYPLLGLDTAPAPTLVLSNTSVADLSQITVFQIDQKASSPASQIDEVRIGRTWAAVTPAWRVGACFSIR